MAMVIYCAQTGKIDNLNRENVPFLKAQKIFTPKTNKNLLIAGGHLLGNPGEMVPAAWLASPLFAGRLHFADR